MADLPLITVVTVCHNNADVIEATIRSVVGQQYPRLHYIVWDGGSTDGTPDVVRQYEEHMAFWTSERSEGTYYAMNHAAGKAVELAGSEAGHWLFFLYAGDLFAGPTVLSKVFSDPKIDHHSLKMIGGGVLRKKISGDGLRLEAAKPVAVIPSEPAFGVSSSFIRADVCCFDLDYPLAADYALQYRLYDEDGPASIAIVDEVIIITQEEDRDARLLNQRVIRGEYLGVRSRHISWQWVKEYFRWRFLG